jgi:hypothetical protein
MQIRRLQKLSYFLLLFCKQAMWNTYTVNTMPYSIFLTFYLIFKFHGSFLRNFPTILIRKNKKTQFVYNFEKCLKFQCKIFPLQPRVPRFCLQKIFASKRNRIHFALFSHAQAKSTDRFFASFRFKQKRTANPTSAWVAATYKWCGCTFTGFLTVYSIYSG